MAQALPSLQDCVNLTQQISNYVSNNPLNQMSPPEVSKLEAQLSQLYAAVNAHHQRQPYNTNISDLRSTVMQMVQAVNDRRAQFGGDSGGSAMEVEIVHETAMIDDVKEEKKNPYDHYILGRTLRETIYGKVKLGQMKNSQTVVAIKLSRLRSMSATEALENPEEEVRVMKILSNSGENKGHPNVLRLIDTCVDAQYHWTVLELCSGGEFFDIISQHGRLNDRTARRYFRQACLGTHSIHQNGFCHLDLSLENLLLDQNRVLKICDFGMTRELTDGPYAPERKHKPGKLGYMSPEIYAGQPFGGKESDIWSLGVILFIMVTGTPPYNQPTQADARFRMIFQGNLRGLLQRWGFIGKVDDNCIALLQALLCPARQRLSIPSILNHPWMQQPD